LFGYLESGAARDKYLRRAQLQAARGLQRVGRFQTVIRIF
jgi:hypothetical protein